MTCLKRYVKLTEPIKADHGHLCLSYCKPFKPVNHDTVRRWIRNVFRRLVEPHFFSAHSTRAADASAARSITPPWSQLYVAGETLVNLSSSMHDCSSITKQEMVFCLPVHGHMSFQFHMTR